MMILRTAKWRLSPRRMAMPVAAAIVMLAIGAPAPTASAISGSMDDWLSAVCGSDGIFDTSTRYAVAGYTCVPNSGFGYVNFDYFRSAAERETILGLSRSAHISRFQHDDLYGAIWIPAGKGNELAPLKQLGFTIQGPTPTPLPEINMTVVIPDESTTPAISPPTTAQATTAASWPPLRPQVGQSTAPAVSSPRVT